MHLPAPYLSHEMPRLHDDFNNYAVCVPGVSFGTTSFCSATACNGGIERGEE